LVTLSFGFVRKLTSNSIGTCGSGHPNPRF
jgi:hypothetical protein